MEPLCPMAKPQAALHDWCSPRSLLPAERPFCIFLGVPVHGELPGTQLTHLALKGTTAPSNCWQPILMIDSNHLQANPIPFTSKSKHKCLLGTRFFMSPTGKGPLFPRAEISRQRAAGAATVRF